MNKGRVLVGYSAVADAYGVGLHHDLGDGKDWGMLLRDDFATKEEALAWAEYRAVALTSAGKSGDWEVEFVGTLA